MNNHTIINRKAKIKKRQITFSFDLANNFDMDDKVFLMHNINKVICKYRGFLHILNESWHKFLLFLPFLLVY